ncbi:MAG: diacylglycerol kinase family protein [Christensenellales bacterium]
MYYIIFNPTAGAGRSYKAMNIVTKYLQDNSIKYKEAHTEYKRHATKLAKAAIGKGYKGIISVGGDGTLLEVAEELFGTDEKLGIIPAGTGNDFRQSVNVPKDITSALQIILSGNTKLVDVGFLDDNQPFLNVAGAGFDVSVIRNTQKVRKIATGGLAYFIGILMSIIKYKSVRLRITANGESFVRDVLLIAVANGKCFGGGLYVAPNASVQDGLFNVLILKHAPRWRILFELPKLKKGRVEKISVAEQFMCSQITIECDSSQAFDIDGEICGHTPKTLVIKPSALNVFCP